MGGVIRWICFLDFRLFLWALLVTPGSKVLLPVFEKEEFFVGEEGVSPADERAEGCGHLQGDEEEDSDPDSQGRGVCGPGLREHFEEESGSEK